MSNLPNQYSPFEFQPESKKFPQEPSPANGLGIAGFITSIAGIITCGALSIFAVLLSAIGLRKEPKGFAIAGLVIGLIGLLELVAAIGFFILFARAVDGIKTIAGQAITSVEMFQLVGEIGKQWESTKQLPTQAEGDLLVKQKTDVSNSLIRYETDGTTFSLRSFGVDQQPNTPDDLVLGPYTFEQAKTMVDQLEQESENYDFENGAADEDITDPDDE